MRNKSPRVPSSRRASGFTLLEILVAVAVFALLSALAYGGLRTLMKLDAGLTESMAELEAVKVAFSMLEQDILYAEMRGVRDELGDHQAAMQGGLLPDAPLALTRHVIQLAEGRELGPPMQRVRYRLEENTLYRDVWDSLDRMQGASFRSRRLLEGLDSIEIKFHDGDDWRNSWPLEEHRQGRIQLPAAVELKLLFLDQRAVRRVLLRPS